MGGIQSPPSQVGSTPETKRIAAAGRAIASASTGERETSGLAFPGSNGATKVRVSVPINDVTHDQASVPCQNPTVAVSTPVPST